jgi:hypothetical protein
MGFLLLKLNERHLLFLVAATVASLIHFTIRKFLFPYFPQVAHPCGLIVLRGFTELVVVFSEVAIQFYRLGQQ